ncbi:MAG: YgjV family protein [Candidatus Gracilibacteria bacterium]|nr:YgjV family protein [Candidatus Gracilibacteria bacterium]
MQEIINDIIEVFNANSIAQSVGLFALIVQMVVMSNKNDKTYILYQSFAYIIWTIHFFLMGLYIAAAIGIFNMLRGFASLKFSKNIKVFLVFFVLYSLNGIFNFQNYISLFAIFASLLACYAFFFLSGKGIIFRLTMLVVISSWFTYHMLNQSIGGAINEFLMMVITIITIFRLYRDKVKLKNNLELEPVLVKINDK